MTALFGGFLFWEFMCYVVPSQTGLGHMNFDTWFIRPEISSRIPARACGIVYISKTAIITLSHALSNIPVLERDSVALEYGLMTLSFKRRLPLCRRNDGQANPVHVLRAEVDMVHSC